MMHELPDFRLRLAPRFPLAAKEAWREQICACQKFLVRGPNKVCSWQKFRVRAVRATDFRRGAATLAPVSGLRPVRRDSGHAAYWRGTHSTAE
jgi:hypothetical protein